MKWIASEFSKKFSTMESTLDRMHDKITVTGKPDAVIFLFWRKIMMGKLIAAAIGLAAGIVVVLLFMGILAVLKLNEILSDDLQC